ncbi:hypothetical protein OWM07_03065 [Deferribacter thermophilus]|uniref:hypothetical protein n=1 Tax=Deferribacter thermophilus TaxID=53573 RepID=UPI003C19B3F0
MSLKFTEFIIHNPSPNLHKLGKILMRKGNKVLFTSDDLFFPKFIERIYIIDESNVNVVRPTIDSQYNDKSIFKLKKGLFTKVFNSKDNNLPFIKALKKTKNFKEYNPINDTEKRDLEDIIKEKVNTNIIAPFVHYNFSEKYRIKGDLFSIYKVEGEITDIFFDNGFYILDNHIEFFKRDDYLIFITSNDEFSIKNLYKHANKYEIKISKLGKIVKNNNPWVLKYKIDNNNLILVNDYSLLNISAKLSEEWFEKMERFLCLEKR